MKFSRFINYALFKPPSNKSKSLCLEKEELSIKECIIKMKCNETMDRKIPTLYKIACII
jgi:hypothetical protein